MKHDRPQEIVIGVMLIVCATFLSFLLAVTGKFSGPSGSHWDILFLVLHVIFAAFLMIKIYAKKRWARALYLIFVSIALLDTGFFVITKIALEPATAVILALARFFEVVALFSLYKKKSSQWFEPKTKKKVFKKVKAKHVKRFGAIIFFISFLVIIYILVNVITPTELVELVGMRNGYILAFIASFFGGFSSVTTATFYAIFTALIAGGLNPYILGITGGISLALGDMLMFYFGSQGRDLVSGKWDKEITYLSNRIKNPKIDRFIPFLGYAYISFTPFPNDWLILFLAAIEYPKNKTYKMIILGDITLVFLFIFLVTKGINIIG